MPSAGVGNERSVDRGPQTILRVATFVVHL